MMSMFKRGAAAQAASAAAAQAVSQAVHAEVNHQLDFESKFRGENETCENLVVLSVNEAESRRLFDDFMTDVRSQLTKTIPLHKITQFDKLQSENEKLKAENAALKKAAESAKPTNTRTTRSSSSSSSSSGAAADAKEDDEADHDDEGEEENAGKLLNLNGRNKDSGLDRAGAPIPMPLPDYHQLSGSSSSSQSAKASRPYTKKRKASTDGDDAGGAGAGGEKKRGRKDPSPLLVEYSLLERALLKYKELYGNLTITHPFVIPSTSEWPEDLWGIKLGYISSRIRVGMAYKKHTASLEEMGFDMSKRNSRIGWEGVRDALLKYKEYYGNMLVPQRYRIPMADVDPRDWPEISRGVLLGGVVHKIRRGTSYRERKEELIAMGFDFNKQESNFSKNKEGKGKIDAIDGSADV